MLIQKCNAQSLIISHTIKVSQNGCFIPVSDSRDRFVGGIVIACNNEQGYTSNSYRKANNKASESALTNSMSFVYS